MKDPYSAVFQQNVDHAFDAIYLIESLPPNQLQTGTTLFEGTISPQSKNLGFASQLFKVGTREEFIAALQVIISKTREGRLAPIIHVDMHGSTAGLELADGSQIDWPDVMALLRSINEASEFNLFLVLAACWGFHFERAISPADFAPVWGLAGPTVKVEAGDIRDGFREFYYQFLTTLNSTAAFEGLNGSALGTPWRYGFRSAVNLFRRAWAVYLTSDRLQEVLDNNAERLALQYREVFPGHKLQKLTAKFRADLENHERFFDVFARRYFAYDKMPENRARFPVSFASMQDSIDESGMRQ